MYEMSALYSSLKCKTKLISSICTILHRCCQIIIIPCLFQAICTMTKSIRNMSGLALTSFIFCLPRFFEYRIDLSHPFKFVLTELVTNHIYNIGYRIILFFLVSYLIPISILVVLNTKLLLALRRAEAYRASLQEKQDMLHHHRQNRSITVIVVTVVSVCISCNLAAMLSHLLWSLHEGFSGSMAELETPRRYVSLVSNILVTFNSGVNFIIYCLCSRNFRMMLKRTLCVCHKRFKRHSWNSKLSASGGRTYVSIPMSRLNGESYKHVNDVHVTTCTVADDPLI